jgi:transcriptional regulator with PAS, ATPase and Fis domain
MPSDGDATSPVLTHVATVELAAVTLYVVDGPDRGVRCEVTYGRASIGTAPSSQLRLRDPTVSRMHCEVWLRRDGVRIVDSGSTNGTYVDGVRILDAMLTAGAAIRIGATTLRVEVGPDPIHLQIASNDRFHGLLGASVEMRRLYAVLDRVAPTESTVLIQGETGTGKELAARAIHEASRRAKGPFVAVDCGAIPENLIESELFGHTRGAFSGALTDSKGLLMLADQGTLFLDEIGELPIALQPKLLRVLESREVRAVGAGVARRIDARVVAATNRHLAQRVNEGTFRDDLYYRLAVVEVVMPPLRTRREDIPLLAAHFLEHFGAKDEALPEAMLATLMARSWPGNVRELRNFIERQVSCGWLQSAGMTTPDASSQAVGSVPVPVDLPLREARAAWTARFESAYVRALLRKVGGNVTRAAELAGVNRRTMQRMIAVVEGREDVEPND